MKLLLALLLLAHGEAAWIMREPLYRADDGAHCCGPTDCRRLAKGEVTETPAGYRMPDGFVFAYGAKGIYVSKDDDYWACHLGRWRCLFVPARMG